MTVDKLRNIPILAKFRERLAAMPTPEVEESLWLRVLVQALVVVGIIATDVAAETFATADSLSVWAVPLSIVGATWSWYRRHKRNIPVKFAIAMGMLWALAFFLSNLRDSLNDTRFVLAQLLIQLQVLHSFDLPRRKDLGYSMV
ncbi:transglutaminase, partial [Planktothrix sp. FACHB-1355]|nr:transglutaminase [Planktothrix sp. FACHB-1355]